MLTRSVLSLHSSPSNVVLKRGNQLKFRKNLVRSYTKRMDVDDNRLSVRIKKGIATLVVPLTVESCSFCLHFDETVGDLVSDIRREDEGLKTVVFLGRNGERLSHSLLIKDLLKEKFAVSINDKNYKVDVPDQLVITDNVITEDEINELTQKSYYRKIKTNLQEMDKHHITLDEYYALCAEFGVEKQDAASLLESLNFLGVVLHFSNPQLNNVIFLKPELLINSLKELLNLRVISNENMNLISRYDEILKEHTELTSLKEEYHSLASRRASQLLWGIFAYLSLQFGIMCRFVWWEFNWDIVEPISYFVTLATLMSGYLFFMITDTEFTYDGLRQHLKNRRLRALYLKRNFDWKRWKELDTELSSLKILLDISPSSKELRKQ
eukprot:TRINITY_DN745_c0_g1_i1.p1 TRINITY_DN745_c0_g1~~TRINITY_DN745_c0_g1_i1.p1  ORF type:complete len:381 (+),score=87.41 TRINITY_DN745_c0_g1_i1:57-1199(+)